MSGGSHDGLAQPPEHFRMSYCADCYHVRAEHLDDGLCFPLRGTCNCVRFSRVSLAGVG